MTLEVHDLHVSYGRSARFGRRSDLVHAVRGISLRVDQGAALGVVGESGCGKSTLARTLCGLVRPSSGHLTLRGTPLVGQRDRTTLRRIQMVFQDPTASLNPQMRVGSVLSELLRVHRLRSGTAVVDRAHELLELVDLPADVLHRYPNELSGGQRQRVGIARALAVEPEVLIADEAVSALDMTTQARIVDLLDRLRHQLDLTLIFISHDLGVVRAACDTVAVMHEGRVVEAGPTEQVFTDAAATYTRTLLAAAPRLDHPQPPGAKPSPATSCLLHELCSPAG